VAVGDRLVDDMSPPDGLILPIDDDPVAVPRLNRGQESIGRETAATTSLDPLFGQLSGSPLVNSVRVQRPLSNCRTWTPRKLALSNASRRSPLQSVG
jgi:hypothetical protein